MNHHGKLLLFVIFIMLCRNFVPVTPNPSCVPDTYSVSVGINTTNGTLLETITCAAMSGNVNFTLDTSKDGYTYFEVDWSSGNLTVANRLDVEYGQVKWDIFVLATDDSGTATATVSLTTFRSTTTTTSTQPPPGYDWFEKSNNKYLFWAVMGFMAVVFGTCILFCVRFHRKGTCLPHSCPQFGHMVESFNRQCTCCPLPCDFYDAKKAGRADDTEEAHIVEHVDDAPWGSTLRQPKLAVSPTKAVAPKKAVTPKKETTPVSKEPDRSVVVSPLVIGNVNLNDVGFDGMRSPGFNAPMFTTFGGKKGTTSRVLKKY